ncbi:hypothetical protein KOW79_003909 [Hemibagrus wyckioides]|uniref:Uncharacterized protein n=1 Tax=Hemibagrus wyckioides TaxID=337641 RepID=A0A9D3SQX3_9TELE|nr:hypothetical protein KOW79_003909 [Hemibagrus wyckioides]
MAQKPVASQIYTTAENQEPECLWKIATKRTTLPAGFKGQRLCTGSLVKDGINDCVLVLESGHLRKTWHSLGAAA